ncbi:Short chain dehydrogenase sol3 [Lachnellula arida]|uniref:Short chain dehydrogenase sol3 n=1 Tax=Lachnellula arida TaxID=1316785 RepID=A0A8T9B895_9HELO|nr:Short chain dehydrogenase sol3 [Lachnellula arida]
MAPKFDITPEKQASIPGYFYRQLTCTLAEVRDVNLADQTAIVTGSNTGIGFEVARQLLDLGLSKLILAVRNEEKGKAAMARLSTGRTLKEGTIEVWNLDMDVYDSIVAFAERTKSLQRLDIIVLNVGIAPAKRVFNENTGHDELIQINYLSNALLAILLLPVVKATRANQPKPSRITFTSSEVSTWTSFKEKKSIPLLAELDKPNNVDMLDRMFVSKLLGQFFLHELAKRVPASVAVINAASPSAVHDSEFNREHDKTFSGAIAKRVMRRIAVTGAVGARVITDAAVNHGDETHGQFFSFQKMVPMAPIIYTSEGEKISAQLWKETMTEFAFVKPEDILKEVSN